MDSKRARSVVAIIGSGWGGSTVARRLDTALFDIVIISPDLTFSYTPFLASAACGLFDFSLATESIRRKGSQERFIRATVRNVDFNSKQLSCVAQDQVNGTLEFDFSFDLLIIAPGTMVNTFNTPGVHEHALVMRTAHDALQIRIRLFDQLERAALPCIDNATRKELLHIVVVGGGPTGMELVAELSDMLEDYISGTYPELAEHISIAIHDVAGSVLTAFDEKLAEYATAKLKARKIAIHTSSHIERIEARALITKEHGRIPAGIVIWATGNHAIPLIKDLPVVRNREGLMRISTTQQLQVRREDQGGSIISDVYALGDAADIEGYTLPTTAEVAVQKATYLARMLNLEQGRQKEWPAFQYKQRALVTYLGHHDGVVGGREDWTGASAWLAWRSGTLMWTNSWSHRAKIVFAWMMDKLVGRDIVQI